MGKITDELKREILRMPTIEKDKILLRLIAKDEMLIAKLQHQLLEDEDDARHKREEILQYIKRNITPTNNPNYHYTPGLMMMSMRDCNGTITRHVKITKDKFGEVELSLALVLEVFINHETMLATGANKAENFADYVVKKADFILKKLDKIHEDYYIEFEEKVNQMLQYIHNYKPCYHFIKEIKLPTNWNR